MAEIVLDRVTKSYPDGATAVKDLSVTIADGEFIILVGPSGCGKSTTLNMIAGLEDISSGELRIGGERVNDKAPKDRDIAMVFQSYALYPHMTVRQNIAFPLTLAKMKKADIAAKVDETAKILDLTDFLDRKPAQLSGGQRQRVAMGRAIVRNPKAFLMDEPLSNLDTKLRVQMRSEIARLQHRLGTTTIYVTHDQTEAMTLGDRVVVLRAGVAQQIGTPEELYAKPANLFVAGFIGSPAMNFFPARMTDVGVSLPFGEITLTQEILDLLAQHNRPSNLIVGIRPEHIEDASLIDTYARIRALTFEVTVDFVESLGSDKYVHFKTEGAGAHAAQLAELAAESGVGENEFVARVSTESKVKPGQTVELAFDTSKLVIFDADTGANLTIPPAGAAPAETPAEAAAEAPAEAPAAQAEPASAAAPGDEQAEPASAPAPSDEQAEPASAPAPSEEQAEPASAAAPSEEQAEPASAPAPSEEQAEPASAPAPSEEQAEPASAAAPSDEQAEPASAAAPSDEQAEPASPAAPKKEQPTPPAE